MRSLAVPRGALGLLEGPRRVHRGRLRVLRGPLTDRENHLKTIGFFTISKNKRTLEQLLDTLGDT